MQSYQTAQLGLSSSKKLSSPTVSDQIFFIKRQSSVLFRGKSQDLSTLTKHNKVKQMDTLFDHYNLFKYGKVLTSDQHNKSKKGCSLNNKKDLNPQIRKYKNGEEARKQSTQLKLRLGQLKDERKGIFTQIKKFVSTDKK